jgi:hypothetical protein
MKVAPSTKPNYLLTYLGRSASLRVELTRSCQFNTHRLGCGHCGPSPVDPAACDRDVAYHGLRNPGKDCAAQHQRPACAGLQPNTHCARPFRASLQPERCACVKSSIFAQPMVVRSPNEFVKKSRMHPPYADRATRRVAPTRIFRICSGDPVGRRARERRGCDHTQSDAEAQQPQRGRPAHNQGRRPWRVGRLARFIGSTHRRRAGWVLGTKGDTALNLATSST